MPIQDMTSKYNKSTPTKVPISSGFLLFSRKCRYSWVILRKWPRLIDRKLLCSHCPITPWLKFKNIRQRLWGRTACRDMSVRWPPYWSNNYCYKLRRGCCWLSLRVFCVFVRKLFGYFYARLWKRCQRKCSVLHSDISRLNVLVVERKCSARLV